MYLWLFFKPKIDHFTAKRNQNWASLDIVLNREPAVLKQKRQPNIGIVWIFFKPEIDHFAAKTPTEYRHFGLFFNLKSAILKRNAYRGYAF